MLCAIFNSAIPSSFQVLPAPGVGEDDSATWESTWQSTSKRSLMVGVGFEFDVKIHCVADGGRRADGPTDGEGGAADGSPGGRPDAAARDTYTIELTLDHGEPDERALWRNYPAEISGATEWLRRKIRRKLKQGVGSRFPVPSVEVRLPGGPVVPAQVVADDGTLTDPPSPEEGGSDDVPEGRPVKLVSVPTPPTLKDVQGAGTLGSLMDASPLPPAGPAGGRPGLLRKSSYRSGAPDAAAGDRDKGGTRDGRRKGKVVPPATIDIPSPNASGSEHSELEGSEERRPVGRSSSGKVVADVPLKRSRSASWVDARRPSSSKNIPPMDNNSGQGSGDSGHGSQQGSLRGSVSNKEGMQMRMGLMSQQTGET